MATYEFKQGGGYDCMTDCYVIKQGGETLFEIDLRHLGQESCQDGHEARKRAEILVRDIVSKLNDSKVLY